VREVFVDTIWSAALEYSPKRTEDIRAITFEAEGRIAFIVSRPTYRSSYHFAAMVAHHALLSQRDEIVRNSRDDCASPSSSLGGSTLS
jgi:hypothetical protein